ncbi:hypothetical protein LOTGIDRAFT_233079 [Lottia gigantea]|uniref:BTB domain-containing protein n=1 Tax=Lottia gigantea TaxID=225164 RepID=V3ZMN8_LOTGI|nr:hypothetical protein LOTGIDRAFT_233079 [Lottia gigantea]ESO92638.1 hypothetical protein LOTGIDRAFT_233079 [Lottia gigantea]
MARRGSGPIYDPLGTPYFLYNQNYGIEILTKLNALRHEATFTDAILCVGHEEFPCHKNVLSVSSPYFRAMFTSELKESRETRICFNEVSPWTLKRIIDYAYSGRLEINQDNAQEMLSAGNLFEYPDIVEACCSFLKRQLHSSNCLGIEYFAHIHSCQKLENEAHEYALENFSIVIDSDEFLDLPLDRVIQYISNDHIDVRNEETVYHAIRRWLNYDSDERKPFLPQLLEQVRLPIMGLQNLRLLESDQLLQGCHKGLQMIKEAQKNHQISNERPEHRRSSLPAIIHPRPSTVAKEVIIVISGINSYITPSVEMYDTQKDRWFILPDLPRLVSWFSVCTVANSILIMGGICDGHVVDTVWKFDVVLRQWTEVARMPERRARHACAVLHDKVYVCGGVKGDGNQLVESIDCYDIYNNSWSKAGQSENPRKQARIVPYKNSLLEIGGIQGEAKVNTIDTYICTGDKLKHSGEQYLLPSRIEFAQILVLNGIFYIIWEDTKKMLALDPLKRTFQPLPDMNCSRIHCATTVLNGKLYVSGGLIDSKPTRLVESFDPVLKRWKKERSMSEKRAYHGCLTLQMC